MSEPVEPREDEGRGAGGSDHEFVAAPDGDAVDQASAGNEQGKGGRESVSVGVHHSTIGYQFIAESLVLQLEAGRLGPEFAGGSRSTEDEGSEASGALKTNGGAGRSERRYRFEDPTLPFPPRVGALKYRLDEGEADRWSEVLDESRLIAVRSPDDGITSAAVHALLEVGDPRPHQIRLLAFGQRNQGRGDLYLENLIGQQLGEPDRPTILVVDGHGALPFIESTLGGEDWARAMSAALRFEEVLVVVKLAAAYRQHLESRLDCFHFPCWKVDFLRPLLRRHVPEGRVEGLAARIVRQRSAGLWGPRADDAYLFEALQSLVSGWDGDLEEALDARERSGGRQGDGRRPDGARRADGGRTPPGSAGNGGATSGEIAAGPSALEAFETRVPYYQGILVCAAYFRGLDVTEFARVAFGLIGKEIVFVAEGELTAEGKAELRQHQRSLREAWPRVGDDILRNCGLIVRTTDGQSTVAFARPGERTALQERVRTSIYFSAVSETLWKVGHLFDRNASQEVVDGATAMFVEALAHHREWRRPQWLCETLLERLSNGETKSLVDLLEQTARDSLVIGRLSQLLRALVGRDGHIDLVQGWLGHLIARRGHLPALQLVMHLRYAEGFNYLLWLKRLSDESPDGVRNAAYYALYAHARQSSVRIWELLTELEGWLPEPEKPAGALSNSNSFALQLIIDYAVDTAETLPARDYGSWPSRYPLFRALAQEPQAAGARLTSLVSWLFHPAIGAVFRQNAEPLAWVVRARLLELWSCVLLGLDGDGAHPEAEAIYRRLLGLFRERTDRDQRHRLITIWRANRERLQAERRNGDRESGKYLARRIARSFRLERDFKHPSETQ